MAQLRQGAAEQRRFRPYGLGNVCTHYYGYGAELAAARLLGVPVPKDWSWEADRERGCDLVALDGTKVHVRSCRNGLEWVFRNGKDSETGIWLFSDTSQFPVVRMAGWLYGKVAGLIADQDVIHRDWLLPMESCPVMEPMEDRFPRPLRIGRGKNIPHEWRQNHSCGISGIGKNFNRSIVPETIRNASGKHRLCLGPESDPSEGEYAVIQMEHQPR